MRIHRSRWALACAFLVALPMMVMAGSAARAVVDPCSVLVTAALDRVRPFDETQLITPWTDEPVLALAYGFTDDRGTPFQVSIEPHPELIGVQRLYSPTTRDFFYVTDPGEIAHAVGNLGYHDHGTRFLAAPQPLPCTVPVHRFLRGSVHRLALDGERAVLEANGWLHEGIAFHAAPAGSVPPPPPPPPPPSDGATFSFAVIPDTQNETYAGEQRMQEHVEWLLANRQRLDLRWVLHSGDVHNWPTPDEIQFSSMSSWLRPLDGVLPYMLTVGNHDTAAVCPGGSACPGVSAAVGLRDTSMWNRYYPPSRFGWEGVFEPGKSDNGWRTFSAGGKHWLILSFELWPRRAVIDWIEQVVASHPHHNVILLSHEILNGDGSLSYSNGGYGENSPAAVWQEVDDYPNVQMTFSGHVGAAANSSLTAVDGHTVATFLQAFHDRTYNPTRIVTVDTAAGHISTSIVANYDRILGANVDYEYFQYRATISGMRFVD